VHVAPGAGHDSPATLEQSLSVQHELIGMHDLEAAQTF
jgi:hypothetical protein